MSYQLQTGSANIILLVVSSTILLQMQLFPQNPLPAPHRTTRSQMIAGDYRLTADHYRQINVIYMALTIKDVYYYRRFTDKAVLFTADYGR